MRYYALRRFLRDVAVSAALFSAIVCPVEKALAATTLEGCFLQGQNTLPGSPCACSYNDCPSSKYDATTYNKCTSALPGSTGKTICTEDVGWVVDAKGCDKSASWEALTACIATNVGCQVLCAGITAATLGLGLSACLACFAAFSGMCSYPCYIIICVPDESVTIPIYAPDKMQGTSGDDCEGTLGNGA